jgi:membrane protease YdiL (CAAX protease family)
MHALGMSVLGSGRQNEPFHNPRGDQAGCEALPAYDRRDGAGDRGVRVAIAGLVGYVAVVYVLLSNTPLRWLDALFLGGIIELLPVFAVFQLDVARDLTVERAQAYGASAVTITFLAAASLALGSSLVGLEVMGVRIEPGRVAYVMSWGVGTFALGMGTLWLFLVLRKRGGWSESRLVRELMPVTRREKGLYAGLSICAGVGEELAYRAYAIPVVILASESTAVALALTSAAFAVLHSYQGALGVVRTGAVGVIMGAVFLHTGSVWPPIVAHVLIDLAVGLVLADRLLS